jgi:nitroreductase
MTELLQLIEHRHSVRLYESRPVEPDKLAQILEGVRMAPSAGNLQAFEVVVVQDPLRRQSLAKAALDQPHVAQAPVVLVFFQHPARATEKYGQRGEELYSLQDATIACAYAQLSAASLGLGCCWVGAFYADPVRRAVTAPESLIPVAMLTLGYPAESPAASERRPLAQLVHRELF